MNLVVITGNLCKNIEVRKTESGKSVVSNTVGVQRDFKENGEYNTDFINIVVWGAPAEYLESYAKKGDRVEVRGRWQNRTYTGEDGIKRYISEVIVEKIKVFNKGQKQETNDDYVEVSEEDLPF